MTITKFEVGDEIWWLDSRHNKIRLNTILNIKQESCIEFRYFIDYKNISIWSSSTVIAKTKEDLINLLYPPKIGPFDYNQFVYVIETNGHSVGINVTDSLVIDKGYIKQCKNDQYLVGEHKDVDDKHIVWYDAASIYATVNTAKHVIDTWLKNNNDN
jgi:hypothetical protein